MRRQERDGSDLQARTRNAVSIGDGSSTSRVAAGGPLADLEASSFTAIQARSSKAGPAAAAKRANRRGACCGVLSSGEAAVLAIQALASIAAAAAELLMFSTVPDSLPCSQRLCKLGA